jgi:hypothetical protein
MVSANELDRELIARLPDDRPEAFVMTRRQSQGGIITRKRDWRTVDAYGAVTHSFDRQCDVWHVGVGYEDSVVGERRSLPTDW